MSKDSVVIPEKHRGLTPFTFKDTDRTVLVRKVSPLLAMKIQQRYPEPTPPMEEVDYGDGVKKLEANPANPAHIEAMKKYNMMLESKIRDFMLDRGVVVDITEEIKEEVAELREYWKENQGEDLGGTDKHVYLSYIAIGSDKDLSDLIDAIMKRSQPTEGAIQSTVDTFPGEVQGT